MPEFVDDDAGYLAWIGAHPEGFVLNVRRSPDPSYVVLHRANCGVIASTKRSAGAYTAGGYRKVCGRYTELQAAAVGKGRVDGSFSAICRHCGPSE